MAKTVDEQLYDVILEAHKTRFTVSSGFARSNAAVVAMAACRGLITTRINKREYGSHWAPTSGGSAFLEEWDLVEDDDEEGDDE